VQRVGVGGGTGLVMDLALCNVERGLLRRFLRPWPLTRRLGGRLMAERGLEEMKWAGYLPLEDLERRRRMIGGWRGWLGGQRRGLRGGKAISC
jgi:hypothetical protein